MTGDRQPAPSVSPSEQKVWKTLDLLKVTTEHFKKKSIESARLDAEILLAHTLGCKRLDLYVQFERLVPPEKLAAFREVVRQRSAGKPVKYILGRCEFMSLEFTVNEYVLIPRPETEVVVEAAIEKLQAMTDRPEPLVLDLGAGSGCIGVTIAVEVKAARLIAADVSPQALTVAKANAERHGVSGRIQFMQGDFLDALAGSGLEGLVDVIVSNPPYVSEAELPTLAPEVRLFEPKMALVAGPDGLAAYKKILPGALQFLRPGGWLVLELGRGQFDAVRALAEATSGYEAIASVQDYLKIDRAFLARRK
jgi:release factor glutamine methyltransferase